MRLLRLDHNFYCWLGVQYLGKFGSLIWLQTIVYHRDHPGCFSTQVGIQTQLLRSQMFDCLINFTLKAFRARTESIANETRYRFSRPCVSDNVDALSAPACVRASRSGKDCRCADPDFPQCKGPQSMLDKLSSLIKTVKQLGKGSAQERKKERKETGLHGLLNSDEAATGESDNLPDEIKALADDLYTTIIPQQNKSHIVLSENTGVRQKGLPEILRSSSAAQSSKEISTSEYIEMAAPLLPYLDEARTSLAKDILKIKNGGVRAQALEAASKHFDSFGAQQQSKLIDAALTIMEGNPPSALSAPQVDAGRAIANVQACLQPHQEARLKRMPDNRIPAITSNLRADQRENPERLDGTVRQSRSLQIHELKYLLRQVHEHQPTFRVGDFSACDLVRKAGAIAKEFPSAVETYRASRADHLNALQDDIGGLRLDHRTSSTNAAPKRTFELRVELRDPSPTNARLDLVESRQRRSGDLVR